MKSTIYFHLYKEWECVAQINPLKKKENGTKTFCSLHIWCGGRHGCMIRINVFDKHGLAWPHSVFYLVTTQHSANQRGPRKGNNQERRTEATQHLILLSRLHLCKHQPNQERCYGRWNVSWDTIGLQCFFPGVADMLSAIREWRQTEHLSWLSKCRHPQFCRRRDSPWSNNVRSPFIWPALWVLSLVWEHSWVLLVLHDLSSCFCA